MKVVCLIRPEPASIYLVNQVHTSFPLATVIQETEAPQHLNNRIKDRIRTGNLKALFRALLYRWQNQRDKPQQEKHYQELFGDQWLEINHSVPSHFTHDINSKEILDKIKDLQPDLILVHGTSLLGKELISLAPRVLNLHWGLSPYYRGVRCTEWALLNQDPLNIGVTIHEITPRIDGGKILAQARYVPKEKDAIHKINTTLTQLGTGLIIDILRLLDQGQTPQAYPQDPSRGKLYQIKDWNHSLNQQIRRLEKSQQLKQILEKPIREALPLLGEGSLFRS